LGGWLEEASIEDIMLAEGITARAGLKVKKIWSGSGQHAYASLDECKEQQRALLDALIHSKPPPRPRT